MYYPYLVYTVHPCQINRPPSTASTTTSPPASLPSGFVGAEEHSDRVAQAFHHHGVVGGVAGELGVGLLQQGVGEDICGVWAAQRVSRGGVAVTSPSWDTTLMVSLTGTPAMAASVSESYSEAVTASRPRCSRAASRPGRAPSWTITQSQGSRASSPARTESWRRAPPAQTSEILRYWRSRTRVRPSLHGVGS